MSTGGARIDRPDGALDNGERRAPGPTKRSRLDHVGINVIITPVHGPGVFVLDPDGHNAGMTSAQAPLPRPWQIGTRWAKQIAEAPETSSPALRRASCEA